MFKFATNKFTNSGNNNNNNNNNNNAGSNSPANNNTQPTGSSVANRASGIISNVSHNANKLLHSHYHHGNSNQDDSLSKRRQIQKDLFGFNKIADKGFPSKPSAMDYDRKLKLLAIGTKNGDIRIYGQPNTRQQQLSSYQDVHPFPILKLIFVQGQHQLITLSERVQRNDLTNKGESQFYLVLWQIPNINDSNNIIEKVKEYQLDPKILSNTKLSAITLLNDNSHLFMGFETGDVYVFNVSSFQLVPGVINKDYILKNIPEPSATSTANSKTPNLKKLNQLGAVESICHHPRQLTKLLIAYQRGLWIIFDFIKNQIDQINQTQQQLESAIFYQYGECVATSHSDGSFILWDLLQSETATPTSTTTAPNTPSTCTSSSAPNIVYGPYPCKPVTKCLVKTYKNDQPLVIFSGGCPRVNYSDKITISVIQGENNHVCFDFTSKIIDFFTIDKPVVDKHQGQTSLQYDNPQALLVLLEEEFVAIDLITENWPQFKLPYLYSVHSSAIICTHYVNGINKQFYDKLKQYGCVNQDSNELYSERDWPIVNSNAVVQNEDESIVTKDLLLTGHEDGSIRFWDVTGMSMTLIYRLKTNDYFQTDSTPLDDGVANDGDNQNEDNWPPFRKVGTFDPYSDDPKLGIQKIYLCPQREILVVAGTAGQVLIMSLNDQQKEVQSSSIQQHKINLIGVSPEVESHFVWKGHEPLAVRQSGLIKLNPGYQLYSLIQLYPPATVSALALNTDWQLVAMGTSHGFALYDYNQMKDLLIRCTLDPAALLLSNSQNESNNNGTISRRKSLKKSLRESFRKLRRGRSQKQTNKQQPEQSIANRPINNTNQMRVDHIDDDLNGGDMHKPIERQVESREFKPMDDIPPSVIRYMYFVRTYITNNQQQTNSLWVGTNTGIIYIYALQFLLNSSAMQQQQQQPSIPSNRLTTTLRSTQSINCLLAKEMRLKHRAPVVHIQVIDQNMNPLPLDYKINQSNTISPQQEQHKVIICSEEQFKVFQLPTLKPVCKFKLTAIEGARVRRIGYNCYTSRTDPKYSEHCLSCLSNLGDLSVYSLPQLKRQVQIQCMKQQDINAITSFVFSKQGQAFYLQSPSEFVHISMSARDTPQTTQTQQQQSKSSSLTQQPSKKSSNKPSTVNKSSSSNNNNNNTTTTSPSQQQPQTSSNNQPVPAPRNNVTKDTVPSDSTSKRNVDSKTKNTDNNNLTNNVSSSPVKSSDKADIVAQPATVIIENNIESNNNNNNNVDKEETKPTDESTISSSTSMIENNANELNTTNKKNETNVNNVSSSNCSSMIETTPVKLSSTNGSNNLINNCSLITAGGQSDSFNVSSSGYNGSCASTSYLANGNASAIDMSMDSVVDRFNDDFHDVSTKKIPTAIDECDDSTSSSANNTTSNNLNHDSSLNVSEMSSDLSTKLNLNGSSTATTTTTTNSKPTILNGSNHKNGQVNYSFESSCATTTSTTNGVESNVINGKHNGKTNGHVDHEINNPTIQPQKASSPLIKQQNGTTNGSNSNNRSNKIEQVTKRIENGSKLEYRETAID